MRPLRQVNCLTRLLPHELTAAITPRLVALLRRELDRLHETGMRGVEIVAEPPDGGAELSSVVWRHELRERGMRAAVLTPLVTLPVQGDPVVSLRPLWQFAQAVEAPFLRIAVNAGGTVGARREMDRLADQVVTIAEASGLTLLLENTPAAPRARDLWSLLSRISHPQAGILWNPAQAALAGERPGVSVPMLGSRLRAVRWIDVDAQGRLAAPGQGVTPLGELARRLLGIGYSGPICLQWPDALADPAEGRRWAEASRQHWVRTLADLRGETPEQPAAASDAKA